MATSSNLRGLSLAPARLRGLAQKDTIVSLVAAWRDRLKPTVYVDWRDLPEDAPSPYQARLKLDPSRVTLAGSAEIAREVVRGTVATVYEIHCACGKRWFSPRLESLAICPRCDRAVVLRDPEA